MGHFYLIVGVCVLFTQLKARDVAGQAFSFVQDLVAALLNFHSYTEQRVHIYPLDSSIEPISPLNQKVRTPGTNVLLCHISSTDAEGTGALSPYLLSFHSTFMRTQRMCAPWRTVSCSSTKASQKTLSQCWCVISHHRRSVTSAISVINCRLCLIEGNCGEAEELHRSVLLVHTFSKKASSLPAEKVSIEKERE